MLRDPVWWHEVARWDVERSKPNGPNALQTPIPPVPIAVLRSAISNAGWNLPPLLMRIYSEVAGGRFGAPAFGFEEWKEVLSPPSPAWYEKKEIQPGLVVWLRKKESPRDQLQIELHDLIWLANDGCQTNWFVYDDGNRFPVVYEQESEPFGWNGEALEYESLEDLVTLFGGEVVAPTFDSWIEAWVTDFQNRFKRDYQNLTVMSELFPEPKYLKPNGEDRFLYGYRLVTADEW